MFFRGTQIRKAGELAVLVVGLAGGRLETETRLQKISFLVDKEVLGGTIEFKKSEFGPHSEDLDNAVKKLEKEGIFDVEVKKDGTVYYYLTEKGEVKFEIVKVIFGDKKVERTRQIVTRLKDAEIGYVLSYVYVKYPEYFEQDSWSFFEILARKYKNDIPV
mgnify:CR=1 FL=1